METDVLDELCINTIRMLAVDMVQKANSGHPGMPMGAASMSYMLWTRFLKHNPVNPGWPDRDRFVLSAGHGSALLYALLHLTGYDLSIDDIKQFRQLGSKTPGHPEYGETPGVEATTGPLGQGFGNSVGMAVAERHLASKFNRPGYEIVDHYTYILASDGDLMEGVSSEAASLAGHLKLGKLICLYDSNSVTLSGETRLTFTEDVCRRFEAYGWHVQSVRDGNDLDSIASAISAARNETARPSLIEVKTHIGYGSPNLQDSFKSHGSPLGADEVALTKKNLGWPDAPDFYIPDSAAEHFRKAVPAGISLEAEWLKKMDAYGIEHPELKSQWEIETGSSLPAGWDRDMPHFTPAPKGLATRTAGGMVMNAVSRQLPLIGGSGDLDPSTFTALKGKGNFQCPDFRGQTQQGMVSEECVYGGANMAFGVREHAMGAILNGIALHGGLIPFGSTFLVFSDYMRPAIRLAALMKLRVIYVFTHDSIAVGEDGPTHQPIEHLASLRAIPNLTVIRPADAGETAEAWRMAVENSGGPVALIMTRQNVAIIDREKFHPAEGLRKGAYALADCAPAKPDIILIATGSEVHPALEACGRLSADSVNVRMISMPSWELFEQQPEDYRKELLPPDVKARLIVEAGTSHGWHKYAGCKGIILGIESFGASAPGDELIKKFGFTADNIVSRAKTLLSKTAAV